MVRKKKMRDPDLFLCIALPDSPIERFKISDIHNFNTSSIEDIRARASLKTGLKVNDLDLIYRGCILQNNKKISDCDLKKGATIFVTKKKQPAKSPENPIRESGAEPMEQNMKLMKHNMKLTKHNIKLTKFVSFVSLALKKPSMLPLCRSYLEKMKEGAGLEKLIAKNPGLISDPVAFAFLQDSVLFETLNDFATAKRAAEKHPALIETVYHIIKEVSEEKKSDNRKPPPRASLNLDLLLESSDAQAQEMDSSQPSDSAPGSSSQRSAADVALLASLGEMQEPYQVEALSSSAPSSSANSPPVLITPLMVSQAMQNAMASVALPIATSSSSTTPTQSSDAADLRLEILQMQEWGLLDVAANMQALRATGGDVQAAINLLLNGGMTSDEEN